MRSRAITRGQIRSSEVIERVRAAMKAMQLETDKNGGVYPYRNGNITSAEVARRAAIHPTTFFTARQRELGREVRRWINTVKERRGKATRPVRREMEERIKAWREKYEGLARSHRHTELELQQREAELSGALNEIENLQLKNESLRSQIASARPTNVVSFQKKHRSK
jgi:hypothetical protein